METAEQRSWVRARLLKEMAAAETRWSERMGAWLAAPVVDGGLGMAPAAVEKAMRHLRGVSAKEPEPER
jgi:hypothetical protein